MLELHHPLVTGVRDMTVDDLPNIVIIEDESHSHPWRLSHFASSLASVHRCILAEGDEGILAYAVTSTVAGEAELLNLTVAPKYQRQGLGRSLLRALSNDFADNVEMFFLEVRESNAAAIGLYESEGFNEVGRRPGYYPGKRKREEAIIMAKELTKTEDKGFFSFFKKK